MKLALAIPLSLVFIVFGPSTAHAQNTLQSFGIKGGALTSTLTPSSNGATSFAPGYVIGLFYTPSPNTFSWQLEGLIQRQGSLLGDHRIRLLYINLPGLLRMNFRQHRTTFFYVVAGGSIGFLIGGSFQQNGEYLDLSSQINRTAVDAIAGAGIEIKRRWSIEVRWNEGLLKTDMLIENENTRNRAIAATVGLRFGG